jgi:large repetitive protein
LKKIFKILSIFLSILLAFQMFLPIANVFALETIGVPTNFTVNVLNVNDLYIRWTGVNNADGYKIYSLNGNQREEFLETSRPAAILYGVKEGNYVLAVTAIKGGIESALSLPVSFKVEIPVITKPAGLKYTISNVNDLTLQWNSVPYADNYKVYQINNDSKELVSTITGTSKAFFGLSEGEYSYEIAAYSNRFGESINNDSVNVTIKYPEITPPQGLTTSIVNGNSVYLQWKPAIYATSYNVYKVIGSEKEHVGATTGTNITLSGLTEGNHVYEVSSISNRFGSESKTFSQATVNVVYPQMSPPVVVLQVNNNNDVSLFWKATSHATSYMIYKIVDEELVLLENTTERLYKINDLSEGLHEFAVIASNEYFGNSQLSNIVSTNIVPILEAPIPKSDVNGGKVELTWSTVPNADTYNVYKVVNGNLELLNNTKDTTLTVEDLQQGDHEFRIVPVSPSGIEGENYATVDVKVEQTDTTPPVTEANHPEKWLQDEYQVQLTATDDQSGVAKTFYSINGSDYIEGATFTIDTEGTTKVLFYSVDNAGNVEEPKTLEVQIDTIAPETTSDIQDKWNKGEVVVALTAIDDQSGVAKTYYSINGSDFVEGTTFTVSDEGVNTVSFYSVDNAGNVEEVKTAEVKIDKTAPVTTSDSTDKWNKREVTVKLTATDNLSGVAKTFYSLNGTDFTEGNTFTVSKEGINNISFYSVDNAGNVEEVKTAEVKIDNSAPVTTSDITDKWNKTDVAVTFTATDVQSGVAKTYYSINGSEFVEGTNFTVSEEGINQVSFYSVDNAGNVEEVQTAEVKIDKVAPKTVSNVQDQWNKGEVAVELTATDATSGVTKTFFSVNGSEFVEGTSFVVSEEGVNQVSFYSVDNAGNIENVQTVEVKIDKTAPTVSADFATEYALGTSIPLTYNANDALSGIAEETITVNGKPFNKGDSLKLDEPGTYKVVITVTDKAGWTSTVEKTYVTYIPGTLVVTPGVIKQNNGEFTVRISLPKGFTTDKIDLSTATLNGVKAKTGTNGLVQQAKNGQFKFNREDFDWKKGTVTVEFRVMVDGLLVIGTTTVEVK